MKLTNEEKGVLLLSAREAINSAICGTNPPTIDYKFYPNLKATGSGAFVTLTMDKKLRGCIGYITSDRTLFDTICDAAIKAATSDPRFFPLKEPEIPKVNIEISVLSPAEPLDEYDNIQLGTHGLILEEDGKRALLLPQVATEQNFSRAQFLAALCEKAGLHPLAWQQKKLNLFVFTADVFSEQGKRKMTYEKP